MNVSIHQLQEKLDELKKRLKAVNQSQNVMSQLLTIKDYFDQIQEYLTKLNDAFNSHVITCDEHNQQIVGLQEQIVAINAKIGVLPDLENYNLAQMSEDINKLSTNIQALSQELEDIKGNSSASLESIELKISAINNSLTTIYTELETILDNISTNQANISTLKTDVSNLKTTQNNQASAQTTLTNNITSIDTRLTKIEANVNTLTEGIDVSELDSRIGLLESKKALGNCFSYKKIEFNLTPYNKKLYTNEYYYSTSATRMVLHKIKLNYQAVNGGSMTISMLLNKEVVSTITIDLSQHPNYYEFTHLSIPVHKHQIIKFKCDFTEIITINSLEIFIFGEDVNFYNYNRNLKVHCFDNYTYITKIENGIAYYDKFLSTDIITLEALSKQLILSETDYSYIDIIYLPYVKNNSSITYYSNICDGIIYTSSNETKKIKPEFPDETEMAVSTINDYGDTDLVCARYMRLSSFYIDKDTKIPNQCNLLSSGSNIQYQNLDTIKPGEWLYVTGVQDNNRTNESSILSSWDSECIALNEDGYMYFLPQIRLTYITKLGQGLSATAYRQADGTINVYLNKLYSVDKYILTLNNSVYEVNYEGNISDCDCIYETNTNILIKHQVSADRWLIVTE